MKQKNNAEFVRGIIKIWKNKWKILSGMWNTWFPNAYVERIARKREEICKKCPQYDPAGEEARCYIEGKPCCRCCGCKIAYKVRSLSSECGIRDCYPGATLRWEAEMTETEHETFEKTTGYKNPHEEE